MKCWRGSCMHQMYDTIRYDTLLSPLRNLSCTAVLTYLAVLTVKSINEQKQPGVDKVVISKKGKIK